MASRIILVSANHDVVCQIADACGENHRDSLVFVESISADKVCRLIDGSPDDIAAVIADLSGEEGGLDVLKALRAKYPGLLLAAAHPKPSADMILSAMRAGASEFLTPPFDMRPLARGARLANKTGGQAAKNKVIAFMPAQSGNGASTAALHAACAAAQELGGDNEVLLVELDFHSSVLRERLKLEADRGIGELLDRTDELDELWPQVVQSWNGIALLPSPASSRTVACKSLQRLPDVLEYAAKRYNTVVLDLPSALMTSTREILGLTDELFLICTPEVTSLHLARRRASELTDLGMPKDAVHIVVNRVGGGQLLQMNDLAQVIGLPIYCSLDNDYLALNEAWEQSKLLSSHAPLGRQLYELGAAMVRAEQAIAKPQRRSWKSLFSVFQ
jgi:pilus assembly protein CpaE